MGRRVGADGLGLPKLFRRAWGSRRRGGGRLESFPERDPSGGLSPAGGDVPSCGPPLTHAPCVRPGSIWNFALPGGLRTRRQGQGLLLAASHSRGFQFPRGLQILSYPPHWPCHENTLEAQENAAARPKSGGAVCSLSSFGVTDEERLTAGPPGRAFSRVAVSGGIHSPGQSGAAG